MKRILSLLLVLTLVFALVACSNEKDTTSEPNTSTTQTETESTDTNDTQTSETDKDESSSDTETPSNSTSTSTPSTNTTPSNTIPSNSTPSNNTPTNSTPTNSTPTNSTPTNSTPTNSTPSKTEEPKPTVVAGEYTVTFDYGYDNIKTTAKSKNYKVTKPEDPKRSGYSFKGWYAPNEGEQWNFTGHAITTDTTLIAKWCEDTGNSNPASKPDNNLTEDKPQEPSTSVITRGTTGDCIWTLDGTHLTISGTGKMADYDYDNEAPWGKSITDITITNNVTNIGNYAFCMCEELKNITIGNSVKSIGSTAFFGCTSLTTITMPKSVTNIGLSAFNSCPNITDVYYSGTKDDQSNIKIELLWSGHLYEATWHYNTIL